MRYSFLDWSGDTGFKFDAGSSRYLILCMVVIQDYERLQLCLRALRDSMNVKRTFEFHYAVTPREIADRLFETLAASDELSLQAGVLVVDKFALPHHFRRMRAPDLLAYFVGQTAGLIGDMLQRTYLRIDGKRADVAAVRRIRVELSRLGYRLNKLGVVPAHKQDGLQVADMIAGAVLDYIRHGEERLAKLGAKVVMRIYEE